MAAGASGQEGVNQPERFSGLLRTVRAWQLSGPGLPAQALPGRSAGLWRVWPGRGAGTVCEIGNRAAEACREMGEPVNTVAHRLCASGLWAIGKLAD